MFDVKYVVAVSGGVDSVVLLDMLAGGLLDDFAAATFVVAHFDHGIRDDSPADELLVRGLAARYGLEYRTKRVRLGSDASEQLARRERYGFLRDVMQQVGAQAIITAHHAGDVVETIAINISRGTGWRGLAVLDSSDVLRPLLGYTKQQLHDYAVQHGLVWHEDLTNSDTKYLRNQLRQDLQQLDTESAELLCLYRDRQVAIKHAVTNVALSMVGQPPYQRKDFTSVPGYLGTELLRVVLEQQTSQRFTRPQLGRALAAVGAFGTGKVCQVGGGVDLVFGKKTFTVKSNRRRSQ